MVTLVLEHETVILLVPMMCLDGSLITLIYKKNYLNKNYLNKNYLNKNCATIIWHMIGPSPLESQAKDKKLYHCEIIL